MTRICCIFNYAPHYRLAVYKLMEAEFQCRFYFGNDKRKSIKKLDYQIFKPPAKELNTVWFFKKGYWITGSLSLLFKPYTHYILTGETHCLSNWVILILSKVMRKKVFIWSHGWYGKETRVQSAVKKVFFSLTTTIFLYGNYARQLMIENGINAKKLHVINNSLDYEQTLEVRKQLCPSTIYQEHFGNNNPVLFFIGRLSPVKKLDILIQVVHLMGVFEQPVNLIIVGDGAEKASLEKLVVNLNLSSKIWFYGPCYNEQETGSLIYNADLCVSPGNVGLTAIHVLSYGTPVITHNNFSKQMPEFEVIQEGVTGSFFLEDDINDLLQITKRWLKNHPRKSAQLIHDCFKRIDECYNPFFQIDVLKKGLRT